MLMVSFSFAQIETKNYRLENLNLGEKPAFNKHNNDSRNAAAAQWFNYVDLIHEYYGADPDYAVGRIATDSNGLTHYSDGTTSHGFFFGWGQTYDFNHTIWSDVAYPGDISFAGTTSYNIDSIAILGHYNRGMYVPSTAVDTLIVGITSAIDEEDGLVSLSVGGNTITVYYGVEYDPATGLQKNATFYKLPLTAEDVAEVNPETDGIYPNYYVLPINLTGITNKVINISYTFKRDANNPVPMDSNILDYSYFYGWLSSDPRSDYFPYVDGTGWVQPADDILYNQNQGTLVQDDNLNYTDPTAWYSKYLYPATIWNENTSYPDILFKISCSDCAIVDVPELEKNNPTIYPNPATNNFTVDLGNDEKADIQLFNIVGQMVYSETITGTAQVNVANLHSGVYMLKVNQNGKTFTTKVVVK